MSTARAAPAIKTWRGIHQLYPVLQPVLFARFCNPLSLIKEPSIATFFMSLGSITARSELEEILEQTESLKQPPQMSQSQRTVKLPSVPPC